MQKIDTREQLIAAVYEYQKTSGYTPYTCVYTDLPDYVVPTRFSNQHYKLVHPCEASTYEDSFPDLPHDFFVDAWAVCHTYNNIDHLPTRAAIYNTCITRENYWVFREAFRFINGTYSVPDFLKILTRKGWRKSSLSLHFVHQSVNDPTMLAYTPSHEYGKRDRQVMMKVGKYLTKYYSDVLTPEQIRAFANQSKNLEVKWARDAEGFRYVYKNGPSSCMSGDRNEFPDIDGDVHPVDVYDTGEFRLAYLEPSPGDIVARGFVHEPSKIWVRVYGDEADTLADELNNLGYTHESSWWGISIRRIEDDSGRIVLPYLDGDCKTVRDTGRSMFLITDRSYDYTCDFTNGVVQEDEDSAICDDCGDRHCEEDSTWSNFHHRSIGPCCIDNYRHAYIARHTRDWVHEDDCVYNNSNGEWYETSYADDRGMVQIENGDWYDVDDCVETYDGVWILYDDAIEVGKDRNEVPIYAEPDAYDPDLIVTFVDNEPRTIHHHEFLPEIDQDAPPSYTITDDFGTQIDSRHRSMRDILLTYGPELTRKCLGGVGMNLRMFSLENTYAHITRIYRGA